MTRKSNHAGFPVNIKDNLRAAPHYSPSLQRDRRENMIRSLEEAISARPLAIALSYEDAVALVNCLKENTG